MAIYPGGKAGDADLHVGVNNKATTLSAGIDNVVTTIPVASTTGFPTAGFISVDLEIIQYTSTDATNFLGATRGADGSAAASHLSAAVTAHNVIAAHHNALKDEVIAVEEDLFDNIRPDVTNLKNNAFNHLLTNGGFEIWQRGTSFVDAAASDFTADGWQTNNNGVPDITISRESTIKDSGSFGFKWDLTALNGTTVLGLRQRLFNVGDLVGKTVTFSMRVRTATASLVNLRIVDDSGNTASSTHTGGDTFETLSVTRTIVSAGSQVEFKVDVNNTATSLFYLDSAMVVFGSNQIDYVPEDPAIEFVRAQRCYETGRITLNCLSRTSVTQYTMGQWAPFATQKRVVPTITVELLRVDEETTASDEKASYSTAVSFTQVHGFRLTIAKTIGGNKPSNLDSSWTAEA